ncbi:MAG TPA: hypothetical protein DIT40_08235 [Alphaproteobacteria bacterium]|nr:hypothetical protein [Alphaproteobacteria bacterium]
MAIIAYATRRISAWTGIQIEARHREALHSAIMTGVRTAMKGGTLSTEAMTDQAIAYARESVPDAIRALAPNNIVLRKLAERYANEALDRLDAAF